MKRHLILLTLCFVMTLALTGCKRSGGGGGSASDGGSTFVASSGGGDSGGGSGGFNQPEPATIALLGGGLVAYALLKRKRK